MNKLAYLSLSILKLSKAVMYEFWYYYVKPKYGEKAKLCFKDTDSFIVYKNRWYLQRHCRRCWNKVWYFKLWIRQTITNEKNKNVIELMKHELGGKVMKQFVGLR